MDHAHPPCAHAGMLRLTRRHHAVEHRIEQVPCFLRGTVGQQLHGSLEVREEHRDLLALAFQRAAGGQDLLREIRWRIGEGGLRGRRHDGRSSGRCRRGLTRPEQPLPGIVTHLGMGIEEFGGEIRERIIIQGELALEGPIRDPLALPGKRDNLIQDSIKVHARPSLAGGGACAHAHPYHSISTREEPERNIRMKCRVECLM